MSGKTHDETKQVKCKLTTVPLLFRKRMRRFCFFVLITKCNRLGIEAQLLCLVSFPPFLVIRSTTAEHLAVSLASSMLRGS